ncbi:MAG: hypothetical protein QOE65_872 [Solirubrobacteraceae bacterium]|nr:hypothetical protein [Solirubrobacteraceae bacterium]
MLALMAACAPAARADVTVGSLEPSPTDTGSSGLCVFGQATLFQSGLAPGSPSYTIPGPTGGVITSWQTRWGTAGSQVALVVLRPVAGGGFQVVDSDLEALAPDMGGVSTFPASIVVQPGDAIGIWWRAADEVHCTYSSTDPADRTATTDPPTPTPPATGSSRRPTTFTVSRDRLNVSAHVVQQTDLAVAQTAYPSPARLGAALAVTIGAVNRGPVPTPATVTAKLPSGLSLASAAAGQGACAQAGANVTCTLGTLAPGASAAVGLALRTSAAGLLTVTSGVSGLLGESNPADNAAATTVAVGPPGLSSLSRTPSVFAPAARSTPLTGRTAARGRAARGTTFAFALDQDAQVRVAIARIVGRRRIAVATLTRAARAGLNHIAFTGRVRGRALAPGRYRATFTASTAGGISPGRALRFTVVAG